MVQLSWSGNTTDKTGFDESRYHLADIKGLNNRGNGQGYIECRTTRWVILGPESAAVGFEDGTRYGQTDPLPPDFASAAKRSTNADTVWCPRCGELEPGALRSRLGRVKE